MVESTPKYSGFSRRLKEAMSEAGVTVTDLKNRLDVTYEMARRYTMGTAMPRDARLRTIGKILGKSPSWLAFGEEQKGALAVAEPTAQYGERRWPLKKAT